ncbi:MAG: NADH-quinone oxidoreductase subunit NuoN [Moraxellaceae bacterium]|jgi:NADH-quinone oxidoreductase subunit N|nr:NADH-quinone oxidoreductase subunit NuoN [Moraxellaceae bacterium]MBP7229007.1 NADH-quinone oxidoreductase subunit NuoN [Moraxellaceae bacterium]MBP8852231.1 NADH-quinone oxidoreductase subunit NuoN [Moraxellaceae bacterium]MBP9045578.1 NADH-quinone oxidoreductase subunit NuoN [Moraxellaceae bacterium]MBP9730781.1 NADH-quinone oxidoreductase subunit NuoN [Moraxellaceae bacterium]
MIFTSSQMLALSPLLVASASVVMVMLSVAWRRHHTQTATLTAFGLNAALIATVLVATVVPQAVTPLLMVDGFSLFYTGLILMGALAASTLAHAYLASHKGNLDEYYLLLGISVVGGIVLVSSRHFAGLFIGLELLSVPVYAMVAYTYRQERSLEAGIKYMVLSAVASAFLLFGMALLYAASGTLSFAGLAPLFELSLLSQPLVVIGFGMMLVGLAFKLSIAPFHLWTPDVYEGAPAPVAMYLATSSKIAVLAVLLRFLQDSHAMQQHSIVMTLSILAGASILFGNVLALRQTNIKRLLGYSSIAHFGYLLVAIVANNGMTNEAVAFYLAAYLVTTISAFGVVSLKSSPYKEADADQLHSFRGMFWRRPYLTAVMTVSMLSLAGIPLTAGFIGKFFVVAAGVRAELWWLLGILVVGSAMGLYYYLRVMVTLFLIEPGMRRQEPPQGWENKAGGVVVLGAMALMLILGVYPQPLLDLIQQAVMP